GTNEVRFEPKIRGTFLRINFAVADPGTLVAESISDLNAGHVNNYVSGQISQSLRNRSVGDPRGIVWNSAGTKAYVTGMGSNNMVVVNPSGSRVGLQSTIE